MRSPFLFPSDADYKRDFGIVRTYIEDGARYLHLETGMPLEECEAWIKQSISKGGKHELRSPKAYILDSEENGNRKKSVIPYSQYLAKSVRENRIVAPSMTTYAHPDQVKSVQAEYTEDKLKIRSKAKKAMFKAEREGNDAEYQYQNCLQTSAKIGVNSLSGAYGFAGTILFNKTAHSALTSNCRCASGNANSNNERFLAGNRHYWSVEIAINNIVNVVNNSNYPLIEQVLEHYGIIHPSVEQVLDAISGSTNYYWRSETGWQRVVDLVSKLSPIERAAYLYTQDAYHLMRLNSDMFRAFIRRMIWQPTEGEADTEKWMALCDEDVLMLCSILRADILAGTEPRKLADSDPEKYQLFVATVRNVIETVHAYSDLIQAFWATKNMPPSLAYFPSSMRRGAVLSDTDSTIFTVQDWSIWYRGQLDFEPESNWVAAVMVYFTSSVTIHILAAHSANMGVAREHLYTLAMKSEFAMPLLALTSRGKHYYSYVGAREGNVYAKPKLDVKGVGLRNSKIPPNIRESSDNLIRHVLDTVMKGQKLDIIETLTKVANEEREITNSVFRGEAKYLSVAKVKTVDSYKNGESNSTYQNYLLWEEVFAPKYGHAPQPPYDCIKVNVDAGRVSDLNAWLDSIEDHQLALRFRNWLDKFGKKGLSQVLLPTQAVTVHGLPAEIIPGTNIRKMLNNIMDAHYLILESLGLYFRNDRITQLVSDTY